jgi:hypothetical protein
LSGNPRGVPPVGTAVLVRYDPADPTSVHIHGWDAPARALPRVLVAAGVIIALVGALMFILL